MAIASYYVDTDTGNDANAGSQGGGEWASLQHAVDSVADNPGDEIHIFCSGVLPDTFVSSSVVALDCTKLKIIGNWPGGANYSNQHYRIEYAGTNELFEFDRGCPVELENFQCDYEHTGTTSPRNTLYFEPGAAAYKPVVRNSYIKMGSSGTGRAALARSDSGDLIDFVNIIVEAVDYPGGGGLTSLGGISGDVAGYWNCTFIIPPGMTVDNFINDSSGPVLQNCLFAGAPAIATFATTDPVHDSCIGVEADPGGTGTNWTQAADMTAIFENWAAGDYSIKAGSPTIDAGAASFTAPPSGAFTTDIAGITRGASWDVGASEYDVVVVVSPILRIPLVDRASGNPIAEGVIYAFALYDAEGGTELVDGTAAVDASGNIEISDAAISAIDVDYWIVGHNAGAAGYADDTGFQGYVTSVDGNTTNVSA